MLQSVACQKSGASKKSTSGAGSGFGSGTNVSELGSKLDLTGEFETECLHSTVKIPTRYRIAITASEMNLVREVHGLFSNCGGIPQYSVSLKTSGDIRRMLSNQINVDLKNISSSMIANNGRIAEIFKGTKMCDMTDWTAGVSKSIKGKTCTDQIIPDNYYTVLKVANANELQMGDIKFDGSGSRTTDRNTSLMPYKFKRVK